MKILCLSDTHIGAGYSHRQDALADTDAMFQQVIDLAVEREVDLVLHGGDVFHRAKPSPAELHCFRRFTRKLERARVPMIAIEGNGLHSPAPGQPSALALFESSFVRTSRTPDVVTEFAGVAVCTLPAVTIGRLVADAGGGDRGELSEQAIDLLLRTARDLFEATPDDRPRVLLGHWMLSGASLPTGLPVDALGGVVLPVHELEEIGYDALVFGDIHRAQELGDPLGNPAFYCGSPMTMDFGEESVEHGCYLLGFDEHRAYNYEFMPLQDRGFVTVDVDLIDAIWLDPRLDETDAIAASIAEHLPLTDAVVRVRVTGTEDQWRRVDQDALLRMLADAGVHKLFGGIQWLPVRETRARAEGLDESLNPLGAVDLWIIAQGLDGWEAASLRELTEAYLAATS
jgi:exonuclease SbcD